MWYQASGAAQEKAAAGQGYYAVRHETAAPLDSAGEPESRTLGAAYRARPCACNFSERAAPWLRIARERARSRTPRAGCFRKSRLD